MKILSSTRRRRWYPLTRGLTVRMMVSVMLAGLVLFGVSFGSQGIATAQFGPDCSPGVFRDVRISWGELERYLAAPEASPEVSSTFDDLIQQVYFPDGTMSYVALQALMTPEFQEITGHDCPKETTTS